MQRLLHGLAKKAICIFCDFSYRLYLKYLAKCAADLTPFVQTATQAGTQMHAAPHGYSHMLGGVLVAFFVFFLFFLRQVRTKPKVKNTNVKLSPSYLAVWCPFVRLSLFISPVSTFLLTFPEQAVPNAENTNLVVFSQYSRRGSVNCCVMGRVHKA